MEDHNTMVECALGTIWLRSDAERLIGVGFEELAPSRGIAPPVLKEARKQLEAYFDGRLTKFDVPLAFNGPAHHEQVWRMLAGIPYGTTTTYGTIAGTLGGNHIARTIGAACAANPFPIILPCHRVIASNGGLTGYLGGLPWKRWLLDMEGVRIGLFA